ncbi:MAG TPA: polysaccharide deacetylase family protein [Terriglobales bacterium]
MVELRLDRALSIGLAKPFLHLTNAQRQPRIPILMYHGIRSGVDTKHPYFETNTSPQAFASQMEFLHRRGYSAVTLSDAVEAIAAGGDGQKRVALTFDDGYLDFYDRALPVLARLGLAATAFIVSGFARKEPSSLNDRKYMDWNQVRDARRHGIEIGSHTVTHLELYTASANEVDEQVGRSKQTIEDELGEPIRSFSYPFAFPELSKEFTSSLRASLQAHGYQNGVTTVIGTATRKHDRFFLPRLPVNSHDDLRLFQAKLQGGYDWLHFPQQIYKRLKCNAPWIRGLADAETPQNKPVRSLLLL